MPATSSAPSIPGSRVYSPTVDFLQDTVGKLVGEQRGRRFPGAQPVSFAKTSFDQLESKNFWVCEKSDGVRVLVLILWNGLNQVQDVFLLDRNNTYHQVQGLFFPHHDKNFGPLENTILDGELVIDVSRRDGRRTLRLYAFDCLVYHGNNLMQANLQSRFGRLKNWVVAPFHDYNRKNANNLPPQPFDLVCKEMQLAYAMDVVIRDIIPKLEHGHDGLIFTCAETPYVTGTDENIMKWKPPEENSVDFRLRLRFPPAHPNSREVDVTARPLFLLYEWLGGDQEEFFDELEVTDEEWDEWKASGEQYDDRIVECVVNPKTGGWRFMRFRDDKQHGNHQDIVDKIIESIRDGVPLNDLLARAPAIRSRWKEREAVAKASRPPAPSARAPPIPPVTPGGFDGRANGGNFWSPHGPPGIRR